MHKCKYKCTFPVLLGDPKESGLGQEYDCSCKTAGENVKLIRCTSTIYTNVYKHQSKPDRQLFMHS